MTRPNRAEASKRNVDIAQAYVSERDKTKSEWFERACFQPIVKLPDQLRLDGEKIDVSILQLAIDNERSAS